MRCFFIGHRDAEETLMPQLEAAVKRHILVCGVTEFVVGQYGAFDAMAARAVIRAKQEFSHITLMVLQPYHPFERAVNAPVGYDGILYPQNMERVPRRFAIVRANRYMIKNSDYLIAYAWQVGGNATKLLEYAKRQKDITITELIKP